MLEKRCLFHIPVAEKRMSNYEYSITSIQKKEKRSQCPERYTEVKSPISPGGEKQGWPVKVFGRRRRDRFFAGLQGCVPGIKNRDAAEG